MKWISDRRSIGTKYTISVTKVPSSGGTVSPDGTVSVPDGQSQSFTITPKAGYKIDSVGYGPKGGDPNSMTPITANGNTYTVSKVTEDLDLLARFTLTDALQHTIEAKVTPAEGGKVSPSSLVVDDGGSAIFTVTANSGYAIQKVSYCSASGDDTKELTPDANGKVTVPDVTKDLTLTAVFQLESNPPSTFKITTTLYPNKETGSVEPEEADDVPAGADRIFRVTPNQGYKISSVMAGDPGYSVKQPVPSNADGTYTVSDVRKDMELLVVFDLEEVKDYQATGDSKLYTIEIQENSLSSFKPKLLFQDNKNLTDCFIGYVRQYGADGYPGEERFCAKKAVDGSIVFDRYYGDFEGVIDLTRYESRDFGGASEWECDFFEKAGLDESLIVDKNVVFYVSVAPPDGEFKELEGVLFKFVRPKQMP